MNCNPVDIKADISLLETEINGENGLWAPHKVVTHDAVNSVGISIDIVPNSQGTVGGSGESTPQTVTNENCNLVDVKVDDISLVKTVTFGGNSEGAPHV